MQALRDKEAAQARTIAELKQQQARAEQGWEESQGELEGLKTKYACLISENEYLLERIKGLEKMLPGDQLQDALLAERNLVQQLEARLLEKEVEIRRTVLQAAGQDRVQDWIQDLVEGAYCQVTEQKGLQDYRYKLEYFVQYSLCKLREMAELIYELSARLQAGKRRPAWEKGRCKDFFISRAIEVGYLALKSLALDKRV